MHWRGNFFIFVVFFLINGKPRRKNGTLQKYCYCIIYLYLILLICKLPWLQVFLFKFFAFYTFQIKGANHYFFKKNNRLSFIFLLFFFFPKPNYNVSLKYVMKTVEIFELSCYTRIWEFSKHCKDYNVPLPIYGLEILKLGAYKK